MTRFLFQRLAFLSGVGDLIARMPAAPLQTTYAANIAPAFEGLVADSRDQTIEARQVETAAGIGFGKVCVQGVADDQVRISEATRPFVGISVARHFMESFAPADLYPQYSNLDVLRKGAIWVNASVAVAVGDPVYYVPATGVLTNVSNTGANTLIANAQWRTSTSGAGLAILLLQ